MSSDKSTFMDMHTNTGKIVVENAATPSPFRLSPCMQDRLPNMISLKRKHLIKLWWRVWFVSDSVRNLSVAARIVVSTGFDRFGLEILEKYLHQYDMVVIRNRHVHIKCTTCRNKNHKVEVFQRYELFVWLIGSFVFILSLSMPAVYFFLARA